MRKLQEQRPRLTLTTNPSVPKRQGVTLEPLDPDEPPIRRVADWVRVAASTRPGNIILTGYTHLDAADKGVNAAIRVDLPSTFDVDGINWVAELLERIGVTNERPAVGRLTLVRGGLPS